jgi:hypothetical protein
VDVVFFNAHDCVVKWSSTVGISCIWIEILVCILQEVDRYYPFFPLGGTVERCQSLRSRLPEICIKLVQQNSQNLKIAKKCSEMNSFDAIIRTNGVNQLFLSHSGVGAISYDLSVKIV